MDEITIFKNKEEQFSFPIPSGTSAADTAALSKLVKKVDIMLATLGSPYEICLVQEAALGKTTIKISGEVRRD